MIIIDEVSMCAVDLLKNLNSRLNEVLSDMESVSQLRRKYDGCHVIFAGDFYQLRPVLGSFVFVETIPYLWKDVQIYDLEEVMRQDNLTFISHLNNLRKNVNMETAHPFFMTLNCPVPGMDEMKCIHLFGTNDEVHKHNKNLFDSSTQPKVMLVAHDLEIGGTTMMRSKKNLFEVGKISSQQNKANQLPDTCFLFVTCLATVVLNKNVADGLVNGASGQVVGFTKKGEEVTVVWMLFQYPRTGKEKRKENAKLFLETNPPVPSVYTPITRITSVTRCGCKYYSRRMLPLTMRNATTVHKTQGMEYDEGIVDLKGNKKAGKYYVAISRFKDAKRVQLRNYNPEMVCVDRKVAKELERLKTNPLILDPPRFPDLWKTTKAKHCYF